MQVLDAAGKARKALRERDGAAPIINYDCSVSVRGVDEEEPEVTVRSIAPHESPSRVAVMEMMLLAGEGAATWAQTRGLPLLFRYAPAPFPRAACLLAAMQQHRRTASCSIRQHRIGLLWWQRMHRTHERASRSSR